MMEGGEDGMIEKEEDLQALVANRVSEGKTLEYKQALPSNSDAEKKEFLADVSSFANASGGDLIFGITEGTERGIPKSVDGLNVTNVDEEISRLDNLIRTGVQPRIPSISIQPIQLENSKIVLIIRIGRSWISPHRVILGSHDKFYSRSSNGKYPLDVGELRVAFNLSETMTERIRNFRLDRISKIFADETPVPFYTRPKTVLHLIPIISFNPAQSYDIGKIASHLGKMPPIYAHGWNNRYNLDGFLTFSGRREEESTSYVQLFRNGIIEAVDGGLLEPYQGSKTIPSGIYEDKLNESLSVYLSILKTLNVEPPLFIFLALLGVKGYSMAVGSDFRVHDSHTIDRDILLLPEVVLESFDIKAEEVLKPCFDCIWNACGFPRSFNYNDDGEWSPK